MNIEKYEQMTDEEIGESTHQIENEWKAAKQAYKQAENEEQRKAILAKYPNFRPGYLPKTIGRRTLVALQQYLQAGIDLAEDRYVERHKELLLRCPDAPELAFHVARMSGGVWPEAETCIATSSQWSMMYALHVKGERFEEAENTIRTSEYCWSRYTSHFGFGGDLTE